MAEKSLKIILLGDEKVGKTSLYSKYVNNKFPTDYTLSKSTQFKKVNLNVNGEAINLQIWDTPGNEQKHKIYMSIYLNSHCILVLFDITNKDSFENIFKKWLPNFFNFFKTKQIEISNFPLVILGNFGDLNDKRAIPKPEIQTRLKEVTKYTNYYLYQEISVKNEKSIENFIKKIIIFINSKSQIFGDSPTPSMPPGKPPQQVNENESKEIQMLK